MVSEIKEKAAIYCRVSTRGQKEEGTSLENQYLDMKKWIKKDFPDLEIKINAKTLEEHFSEDHTGTTFDRPVWNQVKALAEAGEIKHIFIHKMTRFSRPQTEDSYMDVFAEMKFFKDLKVELHIMDTPSETFGSFAGIMTMLQVNSAHVDYSTSVKQMLKGKKFRATAHKRAHTGRRFSKFGYDFISKKRYNNEELLKSKGMTLMDLGTYKINESEAKTVKIIFEEYIKGNSGQKIADLLNDRGIKTKTGKKWQSATIIRMIQDETYKGEAKANFLWNAGDEEVHDQIELGKDFAPAIVTKAIWNRAADIHKNNYKRKSKGTFLLTGFMQCGKCSGNISIRKVAGKYITCHCTNHEHAPYKEYCDLKDFRQETIAPAVWNEVMTVLIDSRTLIKALERSKTDQSPVLKKELSLLEENLKELPKAKERIRQSFIMFGEDMDKAEIDKRYKELEAEESRINNRIQEINVLLTEIKKVELAGVEIEEWMTNIHSFLNKANTEDELIEKQRYVLSQLNVKIIIHDRLEDGSVDFEITGILPRSTKKDIENIFSEIESNVVYPTIEQTSALSFFMKVNKLPFKKILTKNGITYSHALAINIKTCKIFFAISFKSKKLRTKLKKYFRLKNKN